MTYTGKYTRGPQKLDTVYMLGYEMAQYINSSTGRLYCTLYDKLMLRGYVMCISPSLYFFSTFLILNDELSIKLANGILCDAHLHYLEL